ncbi:hypothetical protein [Enterobacter hormaechei]|uniref:hypothetical protein n=1 Tax=Enterobacter hormaechei TaxID=158836 RepID=UPI003905DA7F
MSTITKEQAKDLRNAFLCWQQDYDPVEDKEQYDMFGLGMVAMDALLASLEAETVAWLWTHPERENDVSMTTPHNDEDAEDAMACGWSVQPLYTAMLQSAGGNIGKPLTIKLPDISSKAFWSGTGKNETFHPETYRRWVKEAIETSCTIARVDVEVK